MSKLHYFPIPGRAEPIRLACAIGKIEYTEVNIAFPDWPVKKASMPFGAVPVWEEEGKPLLPQSNAILRYVGRRAGLYPADAWEGACVDALLDAIEEVSSALGPSMREKDEAKKLAMRAELAANVLPMWFGNVEKYLCAQNSEGWAVGSSLSIADLKIYQVVKWIKSGTLDGIPGSILDAYPRTTSIFECVANDERVKAHYGNK